MQHLHCKIVLGVDTLHPPWEGVILSIVPRRRRRRCRRRVWLTRVQDRAAPLIVFVATPATIMSLLSSCSLLVFAILAVYIYPQSNFLYATPDALHSCDWSPRKFTLTCMPVTNNNLIYEFFFLHFRYGFKIAEPNGGKRNTRRKVRDDRRTMLILKVAVVSQFLLKN